MNEFSRSCVDVMTRGLQSPGQEEVGGTQGGAAGQLGCSEGHRWTVDGQRPEGETTYILSRVTPGVTTTLLPLNCAFAEAEKMMT